MAETSIPYKFYTNSTGGNTYTSILPGTNTPEGHTETDFGGALSTQYNLLKSVRGANDPDLLNFQGIYDRYKSGGLTDADYGQLATNFWKSPSYNLTAEQLKQMAGGSQIASGMVSGPVTEENKAGVYTAGAQEQMQQMASDPNMQNIGTADKPLYVPKNSPGAQLAPYLGQNVTEGATPGSLIPNTKTGIDYTNRPLSKHEQGFNQANAELGSNAEGSAGTVGNYVRPDTKNDMLGSFFQGDEFTNNLLTTFQDFYNPINQRKSLTETYNQMLKDSGIQGIDMELVDMKKVIEGTEDDIRTEVMKAGGFATDSQVLALANARNKQLIKNYNYLLDTRNAKEKYLQTAMGLEQADRQAADQRFESMFNMGMQIADYQQKMQTNAIAGIERMVNSIGWDGILEATQGDSYAQSLIEKTYGLPAGGLKQAAEQARAEQARALQKEDLDIRVKESALLTDEYQRRKILSDIATSGSGVYDPAQILAYAQQYASTGVIPSGIPKGSFGIMSQVAKELPKSPGQILDRATGVTPDKLGAAGDAYGALYSAIDLANQLKELDQQRWGGILAGTAGKIFGSDSQQKYVDLRSQIVDLLARARSGATLTPTEEARYSSMLPTRFSNPLGFGADTDVRIDNFINTLTSDLVNKTNTKGWVVNGVTPVTIGDTVYKVGDVIENESGQIGRINADGSITLIQ